MMQKQFVRAFNCTCPEIFDNLLHDFIYELIDTAPVDWLSKNFQNLDYMYKINHLNNRSDIFWLLRRRIPPRKRVGIISHFLDYLYGPMSNTYSYSHLGSAARDLFHILCDDLITNPEILNDPREKTFILVQEHASIIFSTGKKPIYPLEEGYNMTKKTLFFLLNQYLNQEIENKRKTRWLNMLHFSVILSGLIGAFLVLFLVFRLVT
jgi:hypothetical protein